MAGFHEIGSTSCNPTLCSWTSNYRACRALNTWRIASALKAGADGYLVKSSPLEVLLAAIDDVRRGGSPISSHTARKVVRHFHLVGPSPEQSESLSPREQEVLNLLSSGYIYKEISDQLGLGLETVRTDVKNICEKMHVRNRVEAVARHGGKAT